MLHAGIYAQYAVHMCLEGLALREVQDAERWFWGMQSNFLGGRVRARMAAASPAGLATARFA
jgi:hypothetical protein